MFIDDILRKQIILVIFSKALPQNSSDVIISANLPKGDNPKLLCY